MQTLTPKNFQRRGIQFLQDRKFALLGDDVGLGKSMQALLADQRGLYPTLIICTATIKDGWLKEIRTWLGEEKDFWVQIIRSSKDTVNMNTHYIIINYDLINRKDKKIFKQLMKIRYSLIICDEAHKLKNINTARTRRILDPRGLISRTDRLWFLTATPVKNRPIDLHSLIASTRPDLLKPYDTYLKFAYRFCDAFEDKYGLDVRGSSNEEDLADRLKPFMLRRMQEEVLPELPRSRMNVIELECTPEAKRIIQEEEMKTVEIAGEQDIELFTLGEAARIRQALAKYKMKDALALIKDKLEEVDKVVIFYHHTSVLKELLKALENENPVYISGSVPSHKRQAIIEKFAKNPDIRVFIGQTQACGEGVNGLQHVCHTCIFVEPSWSPTDIAQCVGRLARIGQKYMVSVYILVIKSTLEAQMMGTAKWKEKITNKILSKTGEQKMHIEDRLERIEKAISTLVAMLDKVVSGPATAPAPKEKAAPAKATPAPKKTTAPAAKATPKAVKAEPVGDDATIDSVRALATDICKDNGEGKARCVTIIAAVGGVGAKLDKLDQEGLNECFKQFTDVLAETPEDDDDI